MGSRNRSAVLVGAVVVASVGVWGVAAVSGDAPAASTVRGLVERVPETPDSHGEWTIGGRAVVVGPHTRLEERIPSAGTEGYWTQAVTGVVVRAPSWPAPAAYAAGFRPALPEEAGGVGLGRLVKAKVRRAEGGVLEAVEIELQNDSRERDRR